MAKRLTRDTRNAVLCGVAAGFGNYFGVDPVLVRIAFILLVFLNGVGVIAYLVCWLIMPRQEVEAAGPGAVAGAPGAAATAAGSMGGAGAADAAGSTAEGGAADRSGSFRVESS